MVAIGPESEVSEVADPTHENAAELAELDGSAEEILLTEEVEDVLPAASSQGFEWIAPTLALLAVGGWTLFFIAAHLPQMSAPASLATWADWIIDWSVPVALIALAWLLAMRTSRREAGRFTDAAQSLARESTELEKRLSVVNRELSLARDFIAAQSRDLESLGRLAAERLSSNADHLQSLIKDNGEQVEAIDRVSTRAVENMDRLRDDLPVISNSARDVASQIGQAGNVAKDQLEEIVEGFSRLNEFGQASGLQVGTLTRQIDEAIAAFEQQIAKVEQVSTQRFAELGDKSAEFQSELDAREVDAFATIRRRADALRSELEESRANQAVEEETSINAMRARMMKLREDGAEFAGKLREGEREARDAWSAAITALEEQMTEAIEKVALVDQQAMDNARAKLDALREEASRVDNVIADRFGTFQKQLENRLAQTDAREAAALDALEERLAAFDDQILERQEDHIAHVEGLAERGEELAARLAVIDEQMANLSSQRVAAEEGLSLAAGTLSQRLAESRTILEDSGAKVASLTADSERLLEIIRSSAATTRDAIPEAIGVAEALLADFQSKAAAVSNLMGDARDKGAALAEQIGKTHDGGNAAMEQLAELESKLADLAGRSDALAEQARSELSSAIGTLENAAQDALGKLSEDKSATIREIAERIGSESSAAIDSVLREHATTAIEELQKSAFQAGEAGRQVARQLRDQLAIVNELAGNLEQRVSYARERAEEQVDDDFARRMALITESLNSSAIDISKVFETEITDTAWGGYLKGDRGIFTRRAVRLLNNQEAKSVAETYQNDDDFRENVSRYIHDFEAMLRSILSTRDGHAMAVTLLSSDMGKLYVALAQAIERLRN